MEFKQYRRTQIAEMRPVTDEEVKTKIFFQSVSISDVDLAAGKSSSISSKQSDCPFNTCMDCPFWNICYKDTEIKKNKTKTQKYERSNCTIRLLFS